MTFRSKKPKGITAQWRARKHRKKLQAAKPIYAHVTARDPICRACGQHPTTQRHHLEGRRTAETIHNVVGVCDTCHDDLHVQVGGKRLIMRGDPEERLTVMRRVGTSNRWESLDRWL